MKIEPCVRCGRAIKTAENINETGEPCLIAYTMMRTSGVRPKVSAGARRRVICAPCGVSIALGPIPGNGAFNEDIYEGCIELASKYGSLAVIALEQKINPPSRPRLMPGSKPDDTLTPQQLKEPLAS